MVILVVVVLSRQAILNPFFCVKHVLCACVHVYVIYWLVFPLRTGFLACFVAGVGGSQLLVVEDLELLCFTSIPVTGRCILLGAHLCSIV